MFQKRIRNRRIMFLAFCFVGLFVFSTFTSLDRPRSTVNVTPEIVRGNSIPSAIDFSALWNKTYGGIASDSFHGLTLCSDGGYAAVGYSYSFGIMDGDSWVVRTDDDGSVLWTTFLTESATNDSASAIVECTNGDFVIAGFSTIAGDGQARVDRIDADGTPIWSRLFGEPGAIDIFTDVIETSSGSILVMGTTQSWGATADDIILMNLAPNGNEIWYRLYGGAAIDRASALIECEDGGYAFLANTESFGAGFTDFWLVRIDDVGNILWDFPYGGSGIENAADLVEHILGGFVLAGTSRSLGDVQGDFWAIRVDETGTEVWNETYVGSGTDEVRAITSCSNGGFALTGVANFISGIDLAKVTRIDLDGTELWSQRYGGTDVELPFDIKEVSPEEFIVVGRTRSYGAGGHDAWMFLIPGEPQLVDPPSTAHAELGYGIAISLWVESTAPIDMWWIEDTSVFDIVKIGEKEGTVYRIMPPDVGYYEIYVHVNNTAGHETEHIFYIYIDDTTTPYWTDFTDEHTLEFGDQFQYTPSAEDLSFLGEWFLFGSTYFTIDINNGEISNVGTPPVGVYDFEITVGDMYHNTLVDDLQIIVQDTTAPEWNTVLQDQNITYGEDFVYDLDASDFAGIASWSVDNTEFSVDSEGRVRNLITLAPGIHAVTVSVEDVNGNILQGQIIVTVGSPSGGGSPSIFDSAIPFVLGVVATIAVVLVICLIGRRKPSTK